MTRYATPLVVAVALFAAPAPSSAQAPEECPEIDAGDAYPVDLRIGDFVLRAQVRSEQDDADGTRVAFDLGAIDEADCIRAGIEVQDAAGRSPTAGAGHPLAVEICGLPRR